VNILFALYHNLSSNSASHVDGVARQLIARGHNCAVAIPDADAGTTRFGTTPYRVLLFDEAARALTAGRLFPPTAADAGGGAENNGALDVLHCWTPREKLRKFRDRLAAKIPFSTVIHLEDNEWQIARSFLGDRGFSLAQRDKLPHAFPESLTSPVHAPAFFAAAAGFTLLIDSLAELVPPGKPTSVFWPAVDTQIFHPREPNPGLRKELNIPDGAALFVYSGNMHAANFREVRSLYLAIHLLNRQGRPARLIRLGKDDIRLPYGYEDWARQYSIPLGFVEDRHRIADILGLADILIQPGRPDPFNDLRFPSKLPEFFAMAKPVILPRTNIGLVTRHLQDAYVLDNANGPNIAAAVTHILGSPYLRQQLGQGAINFYNNNFSWQRAAQTLEKFYTALLTTNGKTEPVA